jgi:hypothetical protein
LEDVLTDHNWDATWVAICMPGNGCTKYQDDIRAML